jgi:hypothetical protein
MKKPENPPPSIVADDEQFQSLAARSEAVADDDEIRAPSRLKSRIYSDLMQRAEGPLAVLQESKNAGHGLCVFEEIVRVSRVGATAQAFNYCRICHGRVFGERVENAPIYWGNCPYSAFQNR